MATLTIRNVDDETVARLKARAKANGRSLEGELRRILARQAARPSPDALIEQAREIAKLTRPVPQTDSAALVREDRQR